MKCPKCGENMILGSLHSYREIVWRPPNFEEHCFISNNRSCVNLTEMSIPESLVNTNLPIPAFHCPVCTLIIADYGHE
jgi:predicted RNA-binding Zn-ribbon protein involved in translation (DUF1610 family)